MSARRVVKRFRQYALHSRSIQRALTERRAAQWSVRRCRSHVVLRWVASRHRHVTQAANGHASSSWSLIAGPKSVQLGVMGNSREAQMSIAVAMEDQALRELNKENT